MIFSSSFHHILIALLIAMQYPFETDFFGTALPLMQAGWKTDNVPSIQISAAQYGINCMTFFSSIISVFVYYKVKKRRLLISILFFFNAITNFCYLAVNEDTFWLAILLRLMNGIFLGFFHSIIVFYLYRFVTNIYYNFYGYLIQTVMFLGLVIIGLLFSFLHWTMVAIILAVQYILLAGLIWTLPEVLPPPKSITHDYIYQKQHRYHLFVIFLLMLLQQFSGIGIIINNVPRLLAGVGLQLKSHLQSTLMNIIGFLTTLIGAFISVSVQNKHMWAISAFGLALSLGIYGITLKSDVDIWVGTLAVFLFFMFYGFGEGPITWFLSGELFPDSVRIESGALTILFNATLGLIFTFVNRKIEQILGEFGTIIYCMIMDMISMILGLVFIPTIKNNIYESDILI